MKYKIIEYNNLKTPIQITSKNIFDKKYIILLLSFFLPIIGMLVSFAVSDIFPFGKNTTMAIDLKHEYVGFYEIMRSAFSDPGNFFYTFTKSIGGSTLGTYSYYVISPLNLIFLLLPSNLLPYTIMLVQLIKIGLCGLFFSLYLMEVFKYRGIFVILFSTCYGLMSFITANILNHMWVDPILIFPIVFIGLERLFKNKSSLIYVIAMLYMIITNYYIAYMGCIGVFLYSIWLITREYTNPSNYGNPCKIFIDNNKEYKRYLIKKYIKFIILSILCVLASMFIILPTLHSIMMSKGTYAGTVDIAWKCRFSILHILSKAIPGAFDYGQVVNKGMANIFSGSIVWILLIIYFFNKRIKIQEKIVAFLILLFLQISMNIIALTLFWHGMQYPIWYEYRFSWIFTFFCILFAFRAISVNDKITKLQNIVVIIAMVLLYEYAIYKVNTLKHLSFENIIFGAIVIIATLITLNIANKFSFKKTAALLLLVITFIELSYDASCHTIIYNYETLDEYHQFKKVIDDSKKVIFNYENKDKKFNQYYFNNGSTSFYRINKTFQHDNNDAARFSIPGLDHFNSDLERNTVELFRSLGDTMSANGVNSNNSTILSDDILGVKYYIENKPYKQEYKKIGLKELAPYTTRPDLKLYKKIGSTKYTDIYETPFHMPLVMLAEKSLDRLDDNRRHPADFQDDLLNTLDLSTVESNYLKRLSITAPQFVNLELTNKAKKTYSKVDRKKIAYIIYNLNIPDNNYYYIALSPSYSSDNSKIIINGINLPNSTSYTRRSHLYNIAPINNEHKVQLKIELKKDSINLENVSLYQADFEKIKKATEIQNSFIQDVKAHGNKIDAKINSINGNTSYLLVTVPFDESWKGYIIDENNKKYNIKTVKKADTLLAIKTDNIPKNIKLQMHLEYHHKGLKLGVIISTISIILLIGYLVYERKKLKK